MYKIVVADDNHLTIQALQATVPWEEWGFQLVGCAENGIDALSQLSLYHPDIAILDINMPGMTGLEVAKQLLESKERILFIFLTAYDEFSYAQTALQIGAFDYLLKPLDNEALKEILLRAGENWIGKDRLPICAANSVQNMKTGPDICCWMALTG